MRRGGAADGAKTQLATVSITTVSPWIEDIVAALKSLGGAGAYEEIYAEVAARRSSLPQSWQEIVRRTIQQHSSDSAAHTAKRKNIFHSVNGIGKGHWALRHEDEDTLARAGIAENPIAPQGYVEDSAVRKAIELQAVKTAIAHYMALGADEIEELGKPYDLKVKFPDRETHVEVKGSLRTLTSVVLTKNEVQHARDTPGTELIVVDQIRMTTASSGDIKTAGGRLRSWSDWAPSDESLVAKTYDHILG